MNTHITQFVSGRGFSMPKIFSNLQPLQSKGTAFVLAAVLASNALTYGLVKPNIFGKNKNERLYLMEKAAMYVTETESFEKKVRETAKKLNVQPEWLMAVMYSESRFNAEALNFKGSGAVGLIQFMPQTAEELNVTTDQLKKLTHTEQLDYVYKYLQRIREKYGDYTSLTELYLAILYPKALEIKGDFCYTLYANPSQAYKQNSGLDENRDNRVTVSDIDHRMQRVFPTAYVAGKQKEEIVSIDK